MAIKQAIKIFIDEDTGKIDKVDCNKRLAEQGPLFRMKVVKDAIIALEQIDEFEDEFYLSKFDQIGES